MSRPDVCATRRDAATRERSIGKMHGASGIQRQIAWITCENIALVITTSRFSTAC